MWTDNASKIDIYDKIVSKLTYENLKFIGQVIENLKSGAIQGLRKIGITAGASTPEDVIDGVIEYLSSFKAGQK